MTERLYYTDAYTTSFTARVLDQLLVDGQTAVILDRTAFYPSSGGQPHDTGRLTGGEGQSARVVEVRLDESGDILHLLDVPLNAVAVRGAIDWPRRFDFMQQHTGQHILSQACLRLAEAPTVGFHLTADNATIDIDLADLADQDVRRIEHLANSVVWENRPISAEFVTPAEAESRQVRKIPALNGEQLRLINIGDFDLTACGGTHVASTGSVGLIKITRRERRAGGVRLTFRCGERAWTDYDEQNRILAQLMGLFTTEKGELVAAVERLQSELKAARRQNRQLLAEQSARAAADLLSGAEAHPHGRLVKQLLVPAADLRSLARELAANPRTVVLLGAIGDRTELVFARAEDAAGDMNGLLQAAVRHLGRAGGGGSTTFAQGGGAAQPEDVVSAALDVAADAWRNSGGEGV